jgi:hypothetical protein
MFEEAEAKQCPVCGVALAKLEKLPPSHDAASEDGVPVEPELERLPLTYARRGRGALVGIAVAGLGLFFTPWIVQTVTLLHESTVYSGLAVAKEFGWPYAALVAWFVLLPTVLSRRTIFDLRTARLAVALLASIPGITASVLLARVVTNVQSAHALKYATTAQWGLLATLFASLGAFLVALRLGGRVEDIKVSRGSSVGHTVH